MDVILDTNIFRNDLFLKSQNFRVLRDYLKKTDSMLVFPQIVLEELKGVYRRDLVKKLTDLEQQRSALNLILNREFMNKPLLDIDDEAEKYIGFIRKEFDTEQMNIIAYKNDYLPEIVKRAVNREKPFKDGDEGFRDSILWLTLLDRCKVSHEKQVVFISNNFKDFGDGQNATQLHPTLQAECVSINIKVNYFRTLKDFIEIHSSKISSINAEWLNEKIDESCLSEIVSDELKKDESKNVISWYERKFSNESTNYFKVSQINFYDYDDLFLYEMADGRLVINFTAGAEIGIEFEYFEYDPNPYSRWTYRDINTEAKYIDCEIYFSVVYQSDEIQEIEVEEIVLN